MNSFENLDTVFVLRVDDRLIFAPHRKEMESGVKGWIIKQQADGQKKLLTWMGSMGDQESPWPRLAVLIALGQRASLTSPQVGECTS